jgi:hypothetical protein
VAGDTRTDGTTVADIPMRRASSICGIGVPPDRGNQGCPNDADWGVQFIQTTNMATSSTVALTVRATRPPSKRSTLFPRPTAGYAVVDQQYRTTNSRRERPAPDNL